MHTHLELMQLALAEARKGLGRTAPNPAVGALIAREGRVLSTGYHHAAGQPHAEIMALRALPSPELARGADLYVTLEPCSTQGRTPPCTGAILSAGLARVFTGTVDPNPAHAGRGLELLRAAGVEVQSGLLEAECARLNEGWNHWIRTRRPFVIAKAALSLDGALRRPAGESQWLTSPAARAHAQRTLRARVQAILIGAETLRIDDPELTLRLPDAEEMAGRPQPWRVVLTRGRNPLPPESRLFTDAHRERTLVYREAEMDLEAVLADLGERGVNTLLVEGGAQVLTQFLARGLVHRAQFYYAPMLCGAPHPADPAAGRLGPLTSGSLPLNEVELEDLGNGEFCVTGLLPPPH